MLMSLCDEDGFFAFYNVIYVIVTVIFVLVFSMSLISLFRHIMHSKKNNHAPRLTVSAKVVGKRTDFRRSSSSTSSSSGFTFYYVTFEVQSGDRMELKIAGTEYGLLAEGDYGDLTFQGDNYLAFFRKGNEDDL